MSDDRAIEGVIIPPVVSLDPHQLLDVLHELFNGRNPLTGALLTESPLIFRARLPFVHAVRYERKYYTQLKLRVEKDPVAGNYVIQISGVR